MRVLVNGLVIDREAAGVGQYVTQLLDAYYRLYQDEDDLRVIVTPDVPDFGVPRLTVDRRLGSSMARLYYEQTRLAGLMRETGYDVAHFPDYQMPVRSRLPRTVVTVHDLVAFLYPQFFEKQRALLKRVLMGRSVSRADCIIVPSRATKEDLIQVLRVPPERIRIIPHGVKHRGTPRPDPLVPPPYFLAVGTVEPRKNFIGLLRGYRELAALHSDVPPLVIAGRMGWMYEETLATVSRLGLDRQVTFLRYVSEDDLATLYRHALAFVYPSFYEGFGLPVLEAMAYGLPVITTRRGGLAEVAEEVAWFTEPHDFAGIAEGLLAAWQGDPQFLARAAQGPAVAARYRWEDAAQKTREVYQEVGGTV
ncbi:glycosyl transferase group 1 [Sulfobacillus acidophilus DSM 10332]|uniref:Glycosyl transferase group 1 n=1 Tax=Sulfobacillus acidophilus (strain ATCC 700253 / DSM 10332 / NAL) TaxID=679936 RepID=G8TT67_SULAD|nr:glycosyl transferase group 1 [Sulfobacillus acidophilus DSM 10332]